MTKCDGSFLIGRNQGNVVKRRSLVGPEMRQHFMSLQCDAQWRRFNHTMPGFRDTRSAMGNHVDVGARRRIETTLEYSTGGRSSDCTVERYIIPSRVFCSLASILRVVMGKQPCCNRLTLCFANAPMGASSQAECIAHRRASPRIGLSIQTTLLQTSEQLGYYHGTTFHCCRCYSPCRDGIYPEKMSSLQAGQAKGLRLYYTTQR
jgi:hypothetical protein